VPVGDVCEREAASVAKIRSAGADGVGDLDAIVAAD